MAPPLLTLTDIHLTFGGTPLLEGASFNVLPGARVCLVGRNGSGKSTLMKIAAGLLEPDDGVRFLKPGVTARYLPQDPDLSGYDTAQDYVQAGLQGAESSHRIPYYLDQLGVKPGASPATMSGGEARRAALARVLASEPDILMLDEPTNHLDLPIINWLEAELAPFSGALMLISHDRRFLSKLTSETIWVDRGEARTIPQGFANFEDWRDTFLEQEELDRHKLDRKIVREQHWIVHGVSGRRKRNVRRLKDLSALRQTRKEARMPTGQASAHVTAGQSSGKLVAKLEQVSKSFEARQIINDFSLRIGRGDKIGIVGPNGSGKTTLLKLLMGQIEPDSGTVKLGANIEPLVIDQHRATLDPDTTLKDALSGGGDMVMVGDSQKHVLGYMKDFLFLPEQQRTPLHALSGGERARVELARGLRLPSNLLVLDEPTNDLDLETLDLLQELISEYKGTVILVSHDRDFLDRTVESVIAYEGDANWRQYPGGYSDMVRQQRKPKDSQSGGKKNKKGGADKNAKPTPQKLSYKHKFRLENLPAEIAALELKITELSDSLADPDLYTSNFDKFDATSLELQAAQTKLEACEDEWLELEALKEGG